MKKTKIVATIGPASTSKAVLKRLIEEGVNVARLNFSHGEHGIHKEVIKTIRELDAEMGTHTALLADLQGPKLRTGKVKEGTVLENDKELIITTETCEGDAKKVSTTYTEFPKDVNVGDKVLIDDGKLLLEVVKTDKKKEAVLKIIHGGVLTSNKGINLPNTVISLPSLTKKDLVDLKFALEHDVDWIGLSFVRSARDIIELKGIIRKNDKHSRVVAKIEKPEAVEDIDEIIAETDAVMVARGDLGVEIPMQNVPLVQKMIIQKCLRSSKPVIVATQMMESMITSITPTRAEVNDVANAVLDGADAVMLSGETSVGKFPVEVIKAMNSIITEMETSERMYYAETVPQDSSEDRFITDSVCYNSCRLIKRVKGQAIITMSHSGYTGMKVASQRPNCNIFVFTGNKKILTLMSLVWGVSSFYYDKTVSTDHTIADIKYLLKKDGYLKSGDMIINIASMPINEMGMSNMMKLSKV